jgi:thiol-disulfide isomerase/thioredoxin
MKYLSFFLVTLFSLNVSAQGIEFEHDKSFEEVLKMAKTQNKLIFMDCFTTWCGPCKRLSSMVFPDPAVGEYYNKSFINTKFDMERGEGPNLAAKYAIRAYPTLLWLNGNGDVVHKVVGGLDPAGLIQNGKKALDPAPGILAGMHKQYDEGNRDVNFLSDYVSALNNANEPTGPALEAYLSKLTEKDLAQAKHTRTIFNVTNDINAPSLNYIIKNKAAFNSALSEDAVNKKLNTIAEKAANDAAFNKGDAALFNRAIELVKNNKTSGSAERIQQMSLNYYSKVGDWVNYDKTATSYLKKNGSYTPQELNEAAWNYYLNIEDKAQLTKASKWAFEAINKDNKYTYNLTYAYLLYKLENYKEASKACDYAIIRAQEENIKDSSAQALKEAIAKIGK